MVAARPLTCSRLCVTDRFAPSQVKLEHLHAEPLLRLVFPAVAARNLAARFRLCTVDCCRGISEGLPWAWREPVELFLRLHMLENDPRVYLRSDLCLGSRAPEEPHQRRVPLMKTAVLCSGACDGSVCPFLTAPGRVRKGADRLSRESIVLSACRACRTCLFLHARWCGRGWHALGAALPHSRSRLMMSG